jgi:tetratricopeptide (TPR) repeat protein
VRPDRGRGTMPQSDDETNGPTKPLPPEQQKRKLESWTLSRETTIVFFTGVLVAFFVLTAFVVRFYHQTERSLARHWYSAGEAALAASNPADAVQGIRTALVYARENGDRTGASERYEFELAKALAAQGSIDEARAYLIAAAERSPGSAEVNLELARLAAKENQVGEASRYYSAAIFGAWEANVAERRRGARTEYANFLLAHGETAEAQAQLIAIAGGLPPDANLQVNSGEALLKAGANSEALASFQRALAIKKSSEAEIGAGIAAFRLGNYREAERYLGEAARAGALDAPTRHQFNVAQHVVELDPYAAGLSVEERARRASRAFEIESTTYRRCSETPNSTPPAMNSQTESILGQIKSTAPLATEAHLRLRPDDLNSVMRVTFSVEGQLPAHCQPQPADEALQLIAKNRAGAIQQ